MRQVEPQDGVRSTNQAAEELPSYGWCVSEERNPRANRSTVATSIRLKGSMVNGSADIPTFLSISCAGSSQWPWRLAAARDGITGVISVSEVNAIKRPLFG